MIVFGYSSPRTGCPLQVIPNLNLHFDPEYNTFDAVEIGWLGWSLWITTDERIGD